MTAIPLGCSGPTAFLCIILVAYTLYRRHINSVCVLGARPKLHTALFTAAYTVDALWMMMIVLRSHGLHFSDGREPLTSFGNAMTNISLISIFNGGLLYVVWFLIVPMLVTVKAMRSVYRSRKSYSQCGMEVLDILYYVFGRIVMLPVFDTLLLAVLCVPHPLVIDPRYPIPACWAKDHIMRYGVSMLIFIVFAITSLTYSEMDRCGVLPPQIIALAVSWGGTLLGGWISQLERTQFGTLRSLYEELGFAALIAFTIGFFLCTRVPKLSFSLTRVVETFSLAVVYCPLLPFVIDLIFRKVNLLVGLALFCGSLVLMFVLFVWMIIFSASCFGWKGVNGAAFGLAEAIELKNINPCSLHFGDVRYANCEQSMMSPPICCIHSVGNPFFPALHSAEFHHLQNKVITGLTPRGRCTTPKKEGLLGRVFEYLWPYRPSITPKLRVQEAEHAIYSINHYLHGNFVNELYLGQDEMEAQNVPLMGNAELGHCEVDNGMLDAVEFHIGKSNTATATHSRSGGSIGYTTSQRTTPNLPEEISPRKGDDLHRWDNISPQSDPESHATQSSCAGVVFEIEKVKRLLDVTAKDGEETPSYAHPQVTRATPQLDLTTTTGRVRAALQLQREARDSSESSDSDADSPLCSFKRQQT